MRTERAEAGNRPKSCMLLGGQAITNLIPSRRSGHSNLSCRIALPGGRRLPWYEPDDAGCLMSFYVTLRRGGETRIHKSPCSYCKDGNGFGSIFKVRRNNTVWSPPLVTLVEAETYVREQYGKVKSVRCGHCLPPSADIADDLAGTK